MWATAPPCPPVTTGAVEIRRMADRIGIAISGLCSFLFWPYPLTSNDPAKRERGFELAGKIVECARDLGTRNVLVVPGAVCIPWRTDHEPVPNDVCLTRAKDAVSRMIPAAEKAGVTREGFPVSGQLCHPAPCRIVRLTCQGSLGKKVRWAAGELFFH